MPLRNSTCPTDEIRSFPWGNPRVLALKYLSARAAQSLIVRERFLPPISFRQRILLVLLLLGAVPAALLGGGLVATLLRINPARSSRAASSPSKPAVVSCSGPRHHPDESGRASALHAHIRALEGSLIRSQQGFLQPIQDRRTGARGRGPEPPPVVYRCDRREELSRQLSKPIDELLGWTARIRRYESLPPEEADRAAPEFASLRTALRETAASLQQARHAELDSERLRAFREVARRVAHEMKNPLTPVRFAIGQLGKTRANASQEALEVLRAGNRRPEHLARDFANLGRLPEGPAAMVDLGECRPSLLRTSCPSRRATR